MSRPKTLVREDGPSCVTPSIADGNPVIPSSLAVKLIAAVNRSDRNISRRQSLMWDVEERFVKVASCASINKAVLDDLKLSGLFVNERALEDALGRESSLKQALHVMISCLIEASIQQDVASLGDSIKFSVADRVRSLLVSAGKIGEESVEGVVMKLSIPSSTEMFVVKVSRKTGNDSLIHEAFIGRVIVPVLRKYLPNYMYVYGMFRCSPPSFDGKKAITWCSSNDPNSPYLLAENIRDGVPLATFALTSTADELREVLFQVINALSVGNLLFQFNHSDLHAGNVMVRRFKEKISIPFYDGTSISSVLGYINTKVVAYIIDYGYSSVRLAGYPIGNIFMENVRDPSVNFQMFDVYKLLCFLAGALIKGKGRNPGLLEIDAKIMLVNRMFSGFFGESIGVRVQKRVDTLAAGGHDYYECPNSFLGKTYVDYINYMITKKSIKFDECVKEEEIDSLAHEEYLKSGITDCDFNRLYLTEGPPKSPIVYCQAKSEIRKRPMSNQDRDEVEKWVNTSYNPSKDYLDWKGNRDLTIKTVATESGNYKASLPALTTITPTVLVDPTFIDSYKTLIEKMLKWKEMVFNAITYTKYQGCSIDQAFSANIYESTPVLSNDLNELRVIMAYIENNKKIAEMNVDIITRSLRHLGDKKSPAYIFWVTQHPGLAASL